MFKISIKKREVPLEQPQREPKIGDRIFVISGNNVYDERYDNAYGYITEINDSKIRVRFDNVPGSNIWCYSNKLIEFKYKLL